MLSISLSLALFLHCSLLFFDTPGIHSLLLASYYFLSLSITSRSLSFPFELEELPQQYFTPRTNTKVYQPPKMRQSFLSALVLSFSALARATITNPAAGNSWPVEQNQMITWDTTGLQAPLNIHLVPSGAVDATVIIAEIAVNVGNTGSFQWAPPNTITVTDVEIIIIDAKQTIVISEVFIIIILEVSPLPKLTSFNII
jgi:hypothetical protein